MKKFLLIGGIGLAAAGAVFGSPILLGIGVVVAVFGALGWALDRGKATREADVSELGAEARWLLRPIRELRSSLEQTASRATDASTKIIAQEAVVEADEILRKATEMAAIRERLKKGLKGQGEAETNVGRLERQLATATSDGERQALQTALEARRSEIETYGAAKAKIAEIDSRLKVAEATLAELRARLATGSLEAATPGHEDEFSEVVQRLKSLGHSLDEAQEFVQGQQL